MNVILFEGEVDQTAFALSPEQARHVRKILKLKIGDFLRIGLVNGPVGTARVMGLESNAATVELVEWLDQPLKYRPWHVVVALPRPPVFRRVLQTLGSLGVKGITVVNADKVEQSFWKSHVLQPSTIDHNLRLGMEQGVSTYRPPVECLYSFSELIEKVRVEWSAQGSCWVADPSARDLGFPNSVFQQNSQTCMRTHTIFVGPEGGWSARELETFLSLGIRTVSLGSHILKVEVAMAYLAGMLYQVGLISQECLISE